MMHNAKKMVLVALLFPIVVLAILIGYRQFVWSFGKEIVLPISGYDPRDLLSGHYLRYQVEYGINNICSGVSLTQKGYVCLDPKFFSYEVQTECKRFIQGVCNHGRFEAGFERFYVPENKALSLEKIIRERKASVVLSVTSDGQAQVKQLLIEGQPWTEFTPIP